MVLPDQAIAAPALLPTPARRPEPWTCLDVGAGSGFFSATLAGYFPEAIRSVIQVDQAYDLTASGATPDPRICRRRDLPARIERSVILLMDVLEHVEDEQGLLTEIQRRSVGRNPFFITVPALPSLWSYHDVSLGHHRRYTARSLTRALTAAGYEIHRTYYLYGLILPAVWAYRKLRPHPPEQSDMSPVAPPLNTLLRYLSTLEMQATHLNHFGGLTCVAEGTVAGR